METSSSWSFSNSVGASQASSYLGRSSVDDFGSLSWDAIRARDTQTSAALEDIRVGFFLRFDCPSKEHEYAQDLDRHNSAHIIVMLVIGILLLVFDFVADYVGNGIVRLLHDETVVRVTAWARLLQFVFLAIDGFSTLQRRCIRGEMVLCCLIVHSLLLFIGNSHRMCEFWDTDWCDRDDIDDSLLVLLLISMTLVLHVSFIQVRTSRSWILCVAQIAMYFALTLGGLGPSDFRKTITVGVCYAVCTFGSWRGRYSAELKDRIRWSENRKLLMRLIEQQEAHHHHHRRLCEFEATVHAIELPSKDVAEYLGAAIDTKSAQLSSGERCLEVDPPPMVCQRMQYGKRSIGPFRNSAPNPLLCSRLDGRTTDMTLVRRMAKSLGDKDYSLHDFFQDAVDAFPELELFFEAGENIEGSEREYQRTIGALFAVYWLFRLDEDGKHGFCYGVDAERSVDSKEVRWPVRTKNHTEDPIGTPFFQLSNEGKRKAFYLTMDWDSFSTLRRLSGCDGHDRGNDRIVALLCLTAFHDIMKIGEICPTVQPEHGHYCGYEPGSVINDHDVALAYVLEKYPTLLPSFAILPEQEQKAVIFTQGKMHFNHGWFVQAEGPPGAMLAEFKRAQSLARPGDLAFYFMHWFTDLAGAEPTPLGGAEKFVLKFPHSVLAAFLWSVPFLRHLEQETETEVVESYLLARWASTFPDGPEAPCGPEAVACLRLAIMAQTEAASCVEAFQDLTPTMRKILAVEMARTGLSTQCFQRSSVVGGPAFLVYYGPALLQRCQHENHDEMLVALQVLAEVYKAGRELWPATLDRQGENVTLEIGQLKSMEVTKLDFCSGDSPRAVWALVVKNNKEAAVELLGAERLNSLNVTGGQYRALDLSPKHRRMVAI